MLILSRKKDESIMIGDNIEISIVDIKGDHVKLGINAPNDVKDSVPGVAVAAFVDDKKSGRLLGATGFIGMTLEAAVEKAHRL